ncbi:MULTISPECIES: LA2681 family HEPN domain-containing protein [Leptospira]|uniref:LA2681-like HEPN domain-containing protein n=1 Tax=Leptospira interrogans serogroup Icterohaemorrhagiae serovar Lai (strain 56601) TaxID=189518 RepID=Q8F2T7_LEPIN|nr:MULTISPECIES: LA2681 family HEPN domain-containing protein [Leptospira]AAN49880.1 hypothetical protein LA_2681 [Leptospira interrogans serovar Lai str. 56601]AER02981.1 hypothetical protein LIF_A2191 [Leptospira interrogans serovar Lai str. IPAV]MBM2889909.1 hypothetical protein [Leptospira interrogans]
MRPISSKILNAFKDLIDLAQSPLFSENDFFKRLGKYDLEFQNDQNYNLNIEGVIANAGSDAESITVLNAAIGRIKKKIKDDSTPNVNKRLYDIGNMIHSKASILYPYPAKVSVLIDSKEYSEARAYYAKVKNDHSFIQLAMAKTNSANILDQFGRNYESILLYDEVIAIDPDFGMSLANKAKALIYYYALNIDNTSVDLLFSAKQLYEKALKSRDLEAIGGIEAVKYFQEQHDELSKSLENFQPAPTYTPKDQIPYLTFCQSKNLFLNHHFGYSFNADSFTDNMYPPFFQSAEEETVNGGFSKGVYFCTRLYNQILEEFSTARILYFETTRNNFSDKNQITHYIYTYDSTKNSIANGLFKSIYTKLFNILDKVAAIVYIYFLKYEPGDFPSTFGFDWLLKEPFTPKIKSEQNYQLLALNSLAMDFQTGFIYHHLRVRRNNIVHWFLDVYETSPEVADEYHLSFNELEEDVQRLFLISKAALFYLQAAVESQTSKISSDLPLGEMTAGLQ